MDPIRSDGSLELEPFVNNPPERRSQANQIFSMWEELFSESKTILMSELKDSINKIEEVGSNFVACPDILYGLKLHRKKCLTENNTL